MLHHYVQLVKDVPKIPHTISHGLFIKLTLIAHVAFIGHDLVSPLHKKERDPSTTATLIGDPYGGTITLGKVLEPAQNIDIFSGTLSLSRNSAREWKLTRSG
jgi:hypothetical protein